MDHDGASQVKRRKVGDGGAAIDASDDSDSDDAGGDLAADGDWEEFDAMPAQTVDVRGVWPYRDCTPPTFHARVCMFCCEAHSRSASKLCSNFKC